MISAMTNRDWEGHNLYCSEIKFCVPNKLIFEPEMKKVLLDMIDTFIEKLGVYHAVAGIQSVLPYRPQARVIHGVILNLSADQPRPARRFGED